MITIGIDGYEANVKERVGSNVYAFQLLSALEHLTRQQADIAFRIYLPSSPVTDLPANRDGWSYEVINNGKLWTQWALPKKLLADQHQLDVFFSPGHYAPRLCPLPYVSSVMDIGYLKYPDQFRRADYLKLKYWTEYSVKRARKVITISHSTKRDVVSTYQRSDSDVVVAYPALTTTPKISKLARIKTLDKFGIQVPFILYVGTLQPRKNLITLVKAVEILHADGSHAPQLVLAGKVGWKSQPLLDYINQSSTSNHIIQTGYISDHQKHALYQTATALVLVGLYEGFGIPPLEAMAHGTLPIVSTTSSLPEVVGQAGWQVNPESPQALARQLRKALTLTPTAKSSLAQELQSQADRFSWEKSAAIVLDTLMSIR